MYIIIAWCYIARRIWMFCLFFAPASSISPRRKFMYYFLVATSPIPCRHRLTHQDLPGFRAEQFGRLMSVVETSSKGLETKFEKLRRDVLQGQGQATERLAMCIKRDRPDSLRGKETKSNMNLTKNWRNTCKMLQTPSPISRKIGLC